MKGQIIREYGQTLEVESDGIVYLCFPRKNLDSIVVGDWVEFEWNAMIKQGVITLRLPRKSILCRSDRYHPIKEMAANLDQVIVIFATLPAPNEFYLDQYLVAAELASLEVCLVLNKVDLPPCTATVKLMALYQQLGYAVLPISAKSGEGVAQLLAHLAHKTSFLLGASGVGKSSLINRLLQGAVARVETVSDATGKGQHTTSVSMLYHLENGAYIIDVPGIRELKLPLKERDALIHGFPEFRPYLGHCRFRNCTHRDDPGCVIVEKVKAGILPHERLQHYYRMLDA